MLLKWKLSKKNALLERDNTRRQILRSLNLEPSIELSGATELSETMPENLDSSKDLDYALKTRPDLKNIRISKENAVMGLKLSKNNLLPSVSIGGSFIHRDQGLKGNTAFRKVPSGKYPEYGVTFKVEYPLWDDGAKVDVRNAKISLRQLTLQERDLQRQVKDDITEGLERIKTAHEVLEKAQNAEKQTRAFYFGLLRRYRQGRFTAVAVKDALDALAQARASLTQAKINFNISLVRYELARNTIFRTYDVNIDRVLNRMKVK